MKCLICEHESPNFRGHGIHIKKRNCAKSNKLNYVVLWTIEDIQNWIDSNFKIRHDY